MDDTTVLKGGNFFSLQEKKIILLALDKIESIFNKCGLCDLNSLLHRELDNCLEIKLSNHFNNPEFYRRYGIETKPLYHDFEPEWEFVDIQSGFKVLQLLRNEIIND